MAVPALTTVPIAPEDLDRVLAETPPRAGVAQLIGPEGKTLIVGRPANLRAWAARQLGRGRPAKKGGRPPLDLSPIARAIAFTETTSAFAQRLAFERLMARTVPIERRRDLKPPVYIALDASARFPRAQVHVGSARRHEAPLYGPFRSRDAASKAIAALHKRFPLRPCDYTFDPSPTLALGLGCVFAQVETCAAPCLARIAETEYRALAARAAAFLASPWERPGDAAAWLPQWVGDASSARGLVVEQGREGLELYPVVRGSVLEAHAVVGASADREALIGFEWPAPDDAPDDTAWLLSWLHASRKTGRYEVLHPDEDRRKSKVAG